MRFRLSRVLHGPPRAPYSRKFSPSSAQETKDSTKTLAGEEHVKWRREQLRDAKLPLYPHKFEAKDRVSDVVAEYRDRLLGEGESDAGRAVSVAGRIHGVRRASKNLHFIDLKAGDGDIQVIDHVHIDAFNHG